MPRQSDTELGTPSRPDGNGSARQPVVASKAHEADEQVRQERASSAASEMTKVQRRLHQAGEKRHVQEEPFVSKVPVVGPLIAAFRTVWNNVSARWYVLRILHQQNEYNYAVYQTLEELSRQAERQGQGQEETQADLRKLWEQLAELELRLLSARRVSSAVQSSPAGQGQSGSAEPAPPVTTQSDRYSIPPRRDWSYLAFNAAFTALGSVVREAYRQYVDWFRGKKNVLDAACGQGHFLELLKGAGIEAYGVDRDPEMVEMCRLKQLRAEQSEVLVHLRTVPTGSLGGLFCGHLLEHFNEVQLQDFLCLAYDRLGPGTAIVCETPNTQSLFVLANTFSRDPTHQRPVHPETYQFIFRACGFQNVELRYSSAVPAALAPQPLSLSSGDQPELQSLVAQVNEQLLRINAQLFGDQNVAIIGLKPGLDDPP